jgi:sugar phosphate isomerase/epimerase
LSLENFRLAMEKLDPILNDFDFKVAIENHQDLDVVDLIRLCENSRSGKVGVTWDVGNSLSTMRTPHSFFKKISAWILNVHLKDYRAFRTESGFSLRRCVLGEGVTDLKTIASEIIKLPWLENISMELAAHPDRHCDLYSFGYAEAFEHSLEERREFTSWLEARLCQEVVTSENSIVVDDKLISREETEASISVAKFKELFCV